LKPSPSSMEPVKEQFESILPSEEYGLNVDRNHPFSLELGLNVVASQSGSEIILHNPFHIQYVRFPNSPVAVRMKLRVTCIESEVECKNSCTEYQICDLPRTCYCPLSRAIVCPRGPFQPTSST